MFELTPWRRRRAGAPDVPAALDWMDRFFEEFAPPFFRGERDLVPAFDVSETEDRINVKADLPGIDPKDLDISVAGNILTVKGEKKKEEEEKGENFYRSERRYGMFSRSIPLPGEVKSEDIEASYKDGVLRLSIRKPETAKRKRIEIKSE